MGFRLPPSIWLSLLLLGCAPIRDDVEQIAQPIVQGRPSGADEDAAVLIRSGNLDASSCESAEGECGVCSGRLIAPRLVLTAYHCLRKQRSSLLNCSANGEAIGAGVGADMTLEPPANLAVYVGHERAALREVAVEQVVAGFIPSICNQDVAYLVLAEPALDVHTPLRRQPVRFGEELHVAGWGHTLGTGEPLPEQRWARDDLSVIEVGPGVETPAGMFAVGGGSLCQGDSGAVALIDGAAVGVYSRLSGDCMAAQSRNFLQGLDVMQALTADAFRAIGEEPVYVDVTSPATDAGAEEAEPAAAESSGCQLGRTEQSSIGGWIALLGMACALRQRRAAARRLAARL